MLWVSLIISFNCPSGCECVNSACHWILISLIYGLITHPEHNVFNSPFNAPQISVSSPPFPCCRLIPVSCFGSIKGLIVRREDTVKKGGILQLLFPGLMIRRQPGYMACVECLSPHPETLCPKKKEKGKNDLCTYLCVCVCVITDLK